MLDILILAEVGQGSLLWICCDSSITVIHFVGQSVRRWLRVYREWAPLLHSSLCDCNHLCRGLIFSCVLLALQKAHACHGFPICLHFVTVKCRHYLGIRYWFLIEKHGHLLTNHLPVFWRNLKLNRIPMDQGLGYRSPFLVVLEGWWCFMGTGLACLCRELL